MRSLIAWKWRKKCFSSAKRHTWFKTFSDFTDEGTWGSCNVIFESGTFLASSSAARFFGFDLFFSECLFSDFVFNCLAFSWNIFCFYQCDNELFSLLLATLLPVFALLQLVVVMLPASSLSQIPALDILWLERKSKENSRSELWQTTELSSVIGRNIFEVMYKVVFESVPLSLNFLLTYLKKIVVSLHRARFMQPF